MIDGMVEQMGEKIRDLWHSEGGNGLYPPCSLHVSDEQHHNIAPSIVKGNLCLTFDTVFSVGFVEYLPFGYYLSLKFDTVFSAGFVEYLPFGYYLSLKFDTVFSAGFVEYLPFGY